MYDELKRGLHGPFDETGTMRHYVLKSIRASFQPPSSQRTLRGRSMRSDANLRLRECQPHAQASQPREFLGSVPPVTDRRPGLILASVGLLVKENCSP